MPKMKTKSGVKKRFSLTATGKVRMYPSGKRHGMSKRSKKFIRQARGSEVMFATDGENAKKWMPYGV